MIHPAAFKTLRRGLNDLKRKKRKH